MLFFLLFFLFILPIYNVLTSNNIPFGVMSGFIFSTDQSVMSYYRVLRAYFELLTCYSCINKGSKVIRDKDILLTTKIDQILTLGKSSMYDEQDQWIVEFTFIYTTAHCGQNWWYGSWISIYLWNQCITIKIMSSVPTHGKV